MVKFSFRGRPHHGLVVGQVAEEEGAVAGRDAGRELALGEELGAEVALFHHARLPGGIVREGFLDIGPGVPPVEAPGREGATRHAVAAADAAVHVHHDHAVVPPEGGLGGAHPDTGRIVAVVAEQQEGHVLDLLVHVLLIVPGEGVFVMVGPDPLDLPAYELFRGHGVLRVHRVGEIGDIVDQVADIGTLFGGGIVQSAHIDYHGPALGRQGLGKTPLGALQTCFHLARLQKLPADFAAQPEEGG